MSGLGTASWISLGYAQTAIAISTELPILIHAPWTEMDAGLSVITGISFRQASTTGRSIRDGVGRTQFRRKAMGDLFGGPYA
ncbi:hypothetical protein [Methylobacterium mesophilicum]